LDVPKCPKTAGKKNLLFWTISPTRMGLFNWLWADFQAKTLGRTSRPLAGFCVPFWVHWEFPNAPKQHKKNLFLVVLDHFLYKNGPIDLVRTFFQAKTLGHTSRPLAGLCLPLWIHWGGAQMPQNSIKNTISGCFGPFLLQEWAY
jgi:hypothetical protein